MIGNTPLQPTPLPEPLFSQVQEIEHGPDAAREAEERRRQIGYRIDDYPQQTTGQKP